MKTYHQVRFGTAPHQILYSADISLKAKGLYTYMQAKPDGWNFSSERMANELKEGEDAIQSALKELEDTGWLLRRKQRNAVGQWEWEHVVMVCPENPVLENPVLDNPVIKKERVTKKEEIVSDETFSSEDEETQLVECDDWGEELPQKRKKDPRTDACINHFKKLVLKETGTRPAVALAVARKMVNGALEYLSEDEIKDLFEDFMGDGLPDHELMQITRALSTARINRYKAEHGIK